MQVPFGNNLTWKLMIVLLLPFLKHIVTANSRMYRHYTAFLFLLAKTIIIAFSQLRHLLYVTTYIAPSCLIYLLSLV